MSVSTSYASAHGDHFFLHRFLHQNLHGIFESANKSQIPEVLGWAKELGGYFRRYKGGVLQPWATHPPTDRELDLEARATLAFLEVKVES